jgi:PAS domain S-box-containing protein
MGSVRNRVFFYVSVIVAITMTIMFIAIAMFLTRSFGVVEESYAREEVARANELILNQIDQLNLKLADWAQWDDAYAFIQDVEGNQDFIDSNINNEALKILGIESIIFVDGNGRIALQKSIDPETGTEISLPGSLEEHLRKGDFLVLHETVKSAKKGLLALREGPAIVASQPIVKSSGEGPAKGTIIFMSFLDKKWQKEISGLMRLPFSIESFRSPRLSAEFTDAKNNLSGEDSVFVNPVGDDRMVAYGSKKDVYGEPAIIFRMEIPRTIHSTGVKALYLFAVFLAVVGFVFFLSLSALLRREVLSRVEALTEAVSEIRVGGPMKRIALSGDDEFSVLAGKINEMVDTLRKMKLRGEESEKRFQTIADTAPVMIWMSDQNKAFTYFNKGWLEFTGRKLEEVLGEGCIRDVHPNDQDRTLKAYHETFDDRKPYVNEFRLHRRDGEYRFVSVKGVPYYSLLGEFLGYVGVCFDVHDQRANERRREERIEEVEKLNEVMVSRELKMIELKDEVKQLRRDLEEMHEARKSA